VFAGGGVLLTTELWAQPTRSLSGQQV
jgi:hypothetical protein